MEREIRRKNISKLPFEQKERYKWFRSPIKAIENVPTALQYTLMGDRETDIYALMYRTLEQGYPNPEASGRDLSFKIQSACLSSNWKKEVE